MLNNKKIIYYKNNTLYTLYTLYIHSHHNCIYYFI